MCRWQRRLLIAACGLSERRRKRPLDEYYLSLQFMMARALWRQSSRPEDLSAGAQDGVLSWPMDHGHRFCAPGCMRRLGWERLCGRGTVVVFMCWIWRRMFTCEHCWG
jgi:hypothetical protein